MVEYGFDSSGKVEMETKYTTLATNKQTREAEVLGTFLISLQKLTQKKHEDYVI